MISLFDLFRVGIGPSSSHTVGPMRAAGRFAADLDSKGFAEVVTHVVVELHGSLAATGAGHGTPGAVLLGLEGNDPEVVDPATAKKRLAVIEAGGSILLGGRVLPMREKEHIRMVTGPDVVLLHPNGMTIRAWSGTHEVYWVRYYSVGGGFVLEEGPDGLPGDSPVGQVPHPFATADELLTICTKTGMSIADVVLANEQTWLSRSEIHVGLQRIWVAMQDCVAAGLVADGILPGVLRVPRRAPSLYARLRQETEHTDPVWGMDWMMLFALAVNEENAAGGRVVTAPTNGAAGIIPAVLHYYRRFVPGAGDAGVEKFLLTAAAVGFIVKRNASISGAEVGCQGEVGSACAMAAAGLAAVLGGTPAQVENAAEIAMEHNLGLTCDPVAGLVQIPCIERNAVGAVKAVAAARTALHGDGAHIVSLDTVIATMRDTGADMQSKYKETSLGGLAVNVIEC